MKKNYRLVLRIELDADTDMEAEKALENFMACIGEGCDDFEVVSEKEL